MSKEIPYKIYLSENEIPKQWYNAVSYTHLDVYKRQYPCLWQGVVFPFHGMKRF